MKLRDGSISVDRAILSRRLCRDERSEKMNRQKLSQQVMGAILITLLLVGCGAPAATPTPIPPTATPVPPTSTPMPTPIGLGLSNGCGSAPPAAPGETEVLSMLVDGLEREYRLRKDNPDRGRTV